MAPLDPDDAAFVALMRELRERSAELGKRSGLPEEAVQRVIAGFEDPGQFADFVAAYVETATAERQALLETLDVEERVRRVLVHMQRQISVLDAQEDIKSQVQEELGERQREMFLREQLKQIRRELGEDDERGDQEELRETLELLELPPEARKEVDRELARLERISKESMEAQVVRTFLETVAELPWNERSEESLDLVRAQAILDEDHYALGDVKDRVLEFLAVRQLKAETARRPGDPASDEAAAPELTASAGGAPAGLPSRPAVEPPKGNPDEKATKGPILLFVGPPGVGKTSVAKSIARAMGRKYVRISLGGARDEADIRGHRRTYVGAMPGRIIQGMKQAGTRNPVFLLDEVDKLGVSFQGDPASALLEVLDPAQNDSFVDHYLGVPFDLSEVLFICTANFLQNIPAPLLDRMETVDFAGYTEREKLMIARNYLVPRQLTEHGLDVAQIALPDEAVAEVIASYTREAGVRQLERELGKLCAQGGPQDRHPRGGAPDDHAGHGRRPPRPPQGPPGARRPRGPDRRGHGDVLHPGGRRHPLRRGVDDARQGRPGAHRPARRRDEGIRPRRADLRPLSRRRAAHPRGCLRRARRARARPRRRHPQGRAVGGRDHGHRPGLGALRPAGAQRHRHDRRDHPHRARCCRSAG